MAQVMKYHEHPTSYNWSSMPPINGTTTTANFILDIHNAIRNSDIGEPYYNCYGTWVSTSVRIDEVLEDEFGYSSSATSSSYNIQTLEDNLDNDMPVILSGFTRDGGHMWVCDGYRLTQNRRKSSLSFHMNWGWGGNYDGYYSYNNFNPNGNRYFQIEMIHGITP